MISNIDVDQMLNNMFQHFNVKMGKDSEWVVAECKYCNAEHNIKHRIIDKEKAFNYVCICRANLN